MDRPPRYSTIRLNSLSDNFERMKTKLYHQIEEDYKLKGCNTVSMWQHHAIPELLVVENFFDEKRIDQSEELPIAVVDKFCGAAVLRGAHVFAPGVLCLGSIQLSDKVNVFADIDGKCLKGAKEYSGSLTFIGIGIARLTRTDLFNNKKSPAGVAIEMCRPVCVAPSLDLAPGLAFAQNLPSVVASLVLEVQPGLNVLDMCAAPGGKTSHLAWLMKSQGCLIALEKSKSRARKLKQFLESCPHCQFVKVFAIDACKTFAASCDVFKGDPPFPAASFDRVMLDAPCSALGQRPQLGEIVVPESAKSLPAIQRQLLRTAVSLLRPGGLLVYSTCTTLRGENEDLVLWALDAFRGVLSLSPQTPCLRPHSVEGVAVPVQKFGPVVASGAGDFPEDEDTIGFFIAKFQKALCNTSFS